MKIDKEMSIRNYINEKQDREILMKMSKEDIIDRYMYRVQRAGLIGIALGMTIVLILMTLIRTMVFYMALK